MQSIIFPGNTRQPCQARYGVLFVKEDGTRIAQIVVVQSDKDAYRGLAGIREKSATSPVKSLI